MADREAMEEQGGWLGKAGAAGDFINRVGIPSVIILAMLFFVGGILIGKIPSPWVSSSTFESHKSETAAYHAQQIETMKEQTSVLSGIKRGLDQMGCEHKATNDERLKCYRQLEE